MYKGIKFLMCDLIWIRDYRQEKILWNITMLDIP
jgi:hypothetical protein